MEKFLALPEGKRKTIIEAAMNVFGAVGYKKAFVSEIATAAGISKAMVFFYFGNKKSLYLYLANTAGKTMENTLKNETPKQSDDFFNRILQMTKAKLIFMERNPAVIKFIASVYYERDPEVVVELTEMLKGGANFRNEMVLSGADREKFKNDVKPELILKMLVGYAESCANIITVGGIDTLMDEFYCIVDMLKNNFYKEEYLR